MKLKLATFVVYLIWFANIMVFTDIAGSKPRHYWEVRGVKLPPEWKYASFDHGKYIEGVDSSRYSYVLIINGLLWAGMPILIFALEMHKVTQKKSAPSDQD